MCVSFSAVIDFFFSISVLVIYLFCCKYLFRKIKDKCYIDFFFHLCIQLLYYLPNPILVEGYFFHFFGDCFHHFALVAEFVMYATSYGICCFASLLILSVVLY